MMINFKTISSFVDIWIRINRIDFILQKLFQTLEKYVRDNI